MSIVLILFQNISIGISTVAQNCSYLVKRLLFAAARMTSTGTNVIMFVWLVTAIWALLSCTRGQLVPSEYVDYQPGTLNVIISSPHGGDVAPSSVCIITCTNI